MIIAIGLAMLFLVIAGALYFGVLAQAKTFFPASLQDNLTMRFAMGAFIWERSVPSRLRRNYLLSMVFTALAFASMAIAAYLQISLILAMVVGCMSAYTLGYALVQWRRYRDRLGIRAADGS